eukprot:CAMPEP_0195038188 /NCGR_PEP_ID=MMETSP0326_2-20130528/76754_1 /TAXON_ID=2866 ORGANISM="Crypthecodinium cohnii, Strain Seligo" /NCGR_SAMPLE_ID=MMETSP0326_2 /ASSEMBLY_ACC=CAM_ASM_000348 /LENGTH=75 /DNA_ID=CAMNT_0040064535 /DNA_START=269 /DNA_END=493 /DNA_ORIENTATION=+
MPPPGSSLACWTRALRDTDPDSGHKLCDATGDRAGPSVLPNSLGRHHELDTTMSNVELGTLAKASFLSMNVLESS